MNGRGIVSLAAVLAAVTATPADAAITRIHISLTASVTRHVTVTQTDETCPGSTTPAVGSLTETAALTTKRSSTMVVIPGAGKSLTIQMESDRNNSGQILTHGTLTRTSTLGAQGEAVCGNEDPATCGSQQIGLALVGGANTGRSGRGFLGIAINDGPQGFRDPFTACTSPNPAIPAALFKTVPFPRSFMVSCRHGKLTRRFSHSDSFHTSGTTDIRGDTTVKLSVTVARLGPLRGYRC